MKKILLIFLVLSFGCSENLIPIVGRSENGNLSITYYKEIPHGLKKHSYKEYDDATNDITLVVEGSYKKGYQDGVWTEWHKNGQKSGAIPYKKGAKEGKATFWYEGGQKKAEGKFILGKEEGIWTVWDISGQKRAEKRYSKGILISYEEWDSDGTKLK